MTSDGVEQVRRHRRRPSATMVLASGTVLSRLLGFLRVALLAFAIGTVSSPGADAYQTASILPNTIYALVAGGLLTAVLVPHLVRAAGGPDHGDGYANKVISVALVAFVLVAGVAMIAAPLLVRLYGVPPEARGLAAAFALWSLPQILFLGMYAVVGEVLTARRVFGATTWAPVVNNVVVLAVLAVFVALFGSSPHRAIAEWTPQMIAVLAGGATLGLLVQAAVMLVALRRAGFRFVFDLRLRGAGLGGAGIAAFWSLAMLVLLQAATLVETVVANTASGQGAATSALGTAWLILMLPQSVVTVSLLTAAYPQMSSDAAAGDTGAFRRGLAAPLLATVGLLLLASAVMIAAAVPLARLFTHNSADAGRLAVVIVAYLAGLVPLGATSVLQRGFYALADTRTPFVITAAQMAAILPATLGCLLLPAGSRTAAIAMVVSLGTTLQLVAVLVAMRRRIGPITDAASRTSILRCGASFVVSIGCGLVTADLLGSFGRGFATSGLAAALVSVLVITVIGTAAFAATLAVLRGGELSRFRRSLRFGTAKA